MNAARLVVPAVLAVAASALGAGRGPPPMPLADGAPDAFADACASPNFRCIQPTGGGACTPEFVCLAAQWPAGRVAMPPI